MPKFKLVCAVFLLCLAAAEVVTADAHRNPRDKDDDNSKCVAAGKRCWVQAPGKSKKKNGGRRRPCCEGYECAREHVGYKRRVCMRDPNYMPPTPEPTDSPVVTEEPSNAPTDAPMIPTGEMTSESTEEMTSEPTDDTTMGPTDEMTSEPTEEMTSEPTDDATMEPTEEMTSESTEEMTSEPTGDATMNLTEEMTSEPTEEMTSESTEEMTSEPTGDTTMNLTEEMTSDPTEELTSKPTGDDTMSPTEEMTSDPTEEMSLEPTDDVTMEPTGEMTPESTDEMTSEPTEEMTSKPTGDATMNPTEEMTSDPTEEMSLEPTDDVTMEPTGEMTPESTDEMTSESTGEMTSEPIEDVTMEPTEEMTPEPIEDVTMEPTDEMTSESTEEMTPEPTEDVTMDPTEEMTSESTEEMTPTPTEDATMDPTDEITVRPTDAPMSAVSAAPTSPGDKCAYSEYLHPLNSCQNCAIWCKAGGPHCGCSESACGLVGSPRASESPSKCELGASLVCECDTDGSMKQFSASPTRWCEGQCDGDKCAQTDIYCIHRDNVMTYTPTMAPSAMPTTAMPTNPPTPSPTPECKRNSDCPDRNDCTRTVCGLTGVCDYPPLAAGTRCDDGLFCTGVDFCDGRGDCGIHGGNPCNSWVVGGHCNDETNKCEFPPTPAPPTPAPTAPPPPPTPAPTHPCVTDKARCKLPEYWWWQGNSESDIAAANARREAGAAFPRERCCAGYTCERSAEPVVISATDIDTNPGHYGKCEPIPEGRAAACFSTDITAGDCCPGYAGPACNTTDLCYKTDCLNGGACQDTTGLCECPEEYSGPACGFRSCGYGGWYDIDTRKCECHRGWRGLRCDECADPGHGYTFLCVAAHRGRSEYVLARVATDMAGEYLSGNKGAHPTLNYGAIYPNSEGHRGYTYDCACQRLAMTDTSVSRRRSRSAPRAKSDSITDADALLFDTVISDCIANSATSANEMEEMNDLWDDALHVEQKGGVQTWYVVGVVMVSVCAALLIGFIAVLVLYCQARLKLKREDVAAAITSRIQYGQAPYLYQTMDAPVRSADSDWNFGSSKVKKAI